MAAPDLFADFICTSSRLLDLRECHNLPEHIKYWWYSTMVLLCAVVNEAS